MSAWHVIFPFFHKSSAPQLKEKTWKTFPLRSFILLLTFVLKIHRENNLLDSLWKVKETIYFRRVWTKHTFHFFCFLTKFKLFSCFKIELENLQVEQFVLHSFSKWHHISGFRALFWLNFDVKDRKISRSGFTRKEIKYVDWHWKHLLLLSSLTFLCA